MARHQYPADHQEPGFLAELAQRLDKDPAEALARKQPVAAIGAGGDKLQLAGLKMASVDRHTGDIGGHGDSRESQSCARSAPAGPARSAWKMSLCNSPGVTCEKIEWHTESNKGHVS